MDLLLCRLRLADGKVYLEKREVVYRECGMNEVDDCNHWHAATVLEMGYRNSKATSADKCLTKVPIILHLLLMTYKDLLH